VLAKKQTDFFVNRDIATGFSVNLPLAGKTVNNFNSQIGSSEVEMTNADTRSHNFDKSNVIRGNTSKFPWQSRRESLS